MGKAIGVAVLFAVVSLIAFALLAPLAFPGGDLRRIGAIALPLVVLAAGGVGFVVGLRRAGRS